MIFRNVAKATLILPDGRSVAPMQAVEIEKDMAKVPGVAVWIADGKAEIEDSDPAPNIDKMTKKQLVELIKSLGVDPDERLGVDKLRNQAAELLAEIAKN